MNYACTHDFINLEHSSRCHNHIFIVIIFRHFPLFLMLSFLLFLKSVVMIFRYLSFEVNPTAVFKGDVIMTIYVIRIKPFDVSLINRINRMTSTVCNTQLVDEPEVNRKNGDPEQKRNQHQRGRLSS